MMRALLTIAAMIAATIVTAENLPSEEELANAEYEGARSCRACHRTAEQGEQYPKWEEGPHAKAYETLANEQSQQIAEEMGIGNPQEADECLRCHVTAWGVDESRMGRRFQRSQLEEGVGCESCHGPGEYYKKKRTMCEITAGIIEGSAVGLETPDEAKCVTCHNDESPTYPGPFNFEERVGEIAHPTPDARKQEVQEQGCDNGR